jgi:hypothetical protein
MKEVSLVIILNICYVTLFDRFKIDELIAEHGHEVLWLPPYHCHFNPTELVWSQAKRYYNSNIGQNGFEMEAVKKMWEESLEQIFFSITTKQSVHCHMKCIPLLILWTFVTECRHNGTNVVSQPSGNTSNVGKLCSAYKDADEGQLGGRNFNRK